MAQETIGGLLARAIAERGHSQEEAGNAMGVSRETVRKWLNSTRPVFTRSQPRPSWDNNARHLKAFIEYTGEDPRKVIEMCGYPVGEILALDEETGAWLTSILEGAA